MDLLVILCVLTGLCLCFPWKRTNSGILEATKKKLIWQIKSYLWHVIWSLYFSISDKGEKHRKTLIYSKFGAPDLNCMFTHKWYLWPAPWHEHRQWLLWWAHNWRQDCGVLQVKAKWRGKGMTMLCLWTTPINSTLPSPSKLLNWPIKSNR